MVWDVFWTLLGGSWSFFAGRSTTTHGRNIDRTEWNTEPTEPIFGRTDLRKGVSEAKFDVEADFDVKKSLAPPKSAENHEKPKKNANKFEKQMFLSIFFFESESFETRFGNVLQVTNCEKTAKKRTKNYEKFSKKILASKNRKLQIVQNAFSRSFAAIGAKFEGRTENFLRRYP